MQYRGYHTTNIKESGKGDPQQNTARAIEKGVFGVPTLVVKNEIFWGADTTAMAFASLDHPDYFDDKEYRRIDSLPVGQAR